MKKLLVVILLLIVIFLLLPVWTGYTARNVLLRNLSHMRHLHAALNIKNYQRGWFSSTFNIEYKVGSVRPLYLQNAVFVAKVTVYQGPFYWMPTLQGRYQFHFGLYGARAILHSLIPFLKTVTNQDHYSPIKIESTQGFSSLVNTQLIAAPIQYATHHHLSLSLGALRARSVARNRYTKVSGQFSLAAIKIKNTLDQSELTIPEVEGKFALTRNKLGFWYGRKRIYMPLIRLIKDQMTYELQQTSAISKIEVHNKQVSAALRLDVGHAFMDAKQVGSLILQLEAHKLQLLPLISFMQALEDTAVNSNHARLTKQQWRDLLPYIAHALVGAKISMKRLLLTVPLGRLQLSGHVQFANRLPELALGKNPVAYLYHNGHAVLQVVMSPQLLQMGAMLAKLYHQQSKSIPSQQLSELQIQGLLRLLSSNGLFIKTPAGYKLILVYQNRLVFINDQLASKLIPRILEALVTPAKLSPKVAHNGVTISAVNLSKHGNHIVVTPGESIPGSLTYIYDQKKQAQLQPSQLLLGFIGEKTADCIYNGANNSAGSKPFHLTAPSQPGVYQLRFAVGYASDCKDALENEWPDVHQKAQGDVIATVVVKAAVTPKPSA